MFVLIIARQEKFLRMIETDDFRWKTYIIIHLNTKRIIFTIRIIQIYPYVRKVYTQFPHLKKSVERIQERIKKYILYKDTHIQRTCMYSKIWIDSAVISH